MSTDYTDPPMGEHERRRAQRRRAARRRGRGRRAIDEFLEEVGEALALPSREPPADATREAPAQAAALPSREHRADGLPPAPTTRPYARLWLPSLAVLVLVAGSASLIDWPAGPATIPMSFRGTWVTAAGGYEGRRLVLTDSTVQVSVSERMRPTPAIVRSAIVRSTPMGPLLQLVCATEDGADTLEVTLLSPSKLTLRHPEHVVWERVAEQHAAPVPDPATALTAKPLPMKTVVGGEAQSRVPR